MNFRVGQKVVCVDDRDTNKVRKGNIYTIEDVYGEFVVLVGVYSRHSSAHGMLATRFRPLVERKTDISIFTAMLTGNKQSEPAE